MNIHTRKMNSCALKPTNDFTTKLNLISFLFQMEYQRADNGRVRSICQHCPGEFDFIYFRCFWNKRLSTLYRPEPNQNGTLSNGHSSNGHGSNGHGSNGYITRGTGGLHEDVDFPTNLKTLTRRRPVTWMRPHVELTFLILFNQLL